MSGRLPGDLSTHTHFYRGEAELEEALAILAERAAAGRSLRLWCAGCSTGAEPYTLAMLCVERGIDAVIHATDLNPEALAAARAARFPEIALRLTPQRLRERYFVRAGADHVVVPDIVARVTFERSDLRTDPLPLGPAGDGEPGWDVILCRNVLIYYEPETADAIVARLATALRPDGVLIVGSTDPLAFRALGSLRAIGPGHVASYAHAERAERASNARPAATAAAPGRAAQPAAPAPSAAPAVSPASPDPGDGAGAHPMAPVAPAEPVRPGEVARPEEVVRATAGAAGVSAVPAGAPAVDLEPLLAAACAHLADHLWDDAEHVLLRTERAAPLAPEPPLYLGVLRRKQGRFDEAAEHLRRAVFLAPGCWLASYLLAGVWERLGEKARARLELSRTLATLDALGPAAARRAWPAGAERARLAFDPEEVARACRSRLGL